LAAVLVSGDWLATAAGTVSLDSGSNSGSVDAELVKSVTAGSSQAANVHVSGKWTCRLT
jgi:hypothetical protein